MTTKDYVACIKALLNEGRSMEDLASLNRYALAHGEITLETYSAAARVLVKEYLKR